MMRNSSIHSFFFYGHFSLSPLMLLKSRHTLYGCVTFATFGSPHFDLSFTLYAFYLRPRERERDAVYFHSRVAIFDVWCPRARVCVCLLMCEADQSSQSRFITLHSIRSGRLFSLMTLRRLPVNPRELQAMVFFGGQTALPIYVSSPLSYSLFSLMPFCFGYILRASLVSLCHDSWLGIGSPFPPFFIAGCVYIHIDIHRYTHFRSICNPTAAAYYILVIPFHRHNSRCSACTRQGS